MKTLNIKFDANTADRFPVYAKYDGQHQPQPAYIELNTRTGELTAAYSGEIGNAVPMTVYHGIDLRYPINCQLRASEIQDAIGKIATLLQRVLNGHSEEWDGNNYVGRMSDDAEDADTEIFLALADIQPDGGLIESLHQWIEPQPFPSEGQSVEDFAADVVASDGEGGSWFEKPYTTEEMLSELRDVWAEMLYAGNDIPAVVARHLIEHGTCDGSNWMDELREFAAAE
ncbi:hypothetical protein GJQ54_05245 [Oceanospirillaceae bacterium ASx5O]|nr:hypothetical protein GJQ54_05245 [Oceanospirillaceae bacterium ASx5O]